MSESDYIDVLNKPFIYAVLLVIYANSLSGCSMHISSTELSDFSQKNKHQPLQSIIIPQKMRKKL